MKKITIAIDGYSSCGKSTVAKQLASLLSYTYIDTGAMYRAVTLYFIRNQFAEFDNAEKVKACIEPLVIDFRNNGKSSHNTIHLNGEDVEKEIREMQVSQMVSRVSAIPEVRKKLVTLQQKMGAGKGVVLDGRDIGTVVFPDAELKIFMTAEPNIRAERRLAEMKEKGIQVSFDEILKNIEQRDYLDTNREDGPLRRADNAIVLDNTKMNKEEQLQYLVGLVNQISKN